jgi:hypothetical protein
MSKLFISIVVTVAFSGSLFGQIIDKNPKTITQPITSKLLSKVDIALAKKMGEVEGKTYRNRFFAFQLDFPSTWLISDKALEATMKKQVINPELVPPKAKSQENQTRLDTAAKNALNLLTAYKLPPGSTNNAVFRISAENLESQPNVKDAVDYFDLMLETFKVVKLPADFVYSEVRAEQLGRKQFAFLDTSTKAGKKRMYATVKDGFAVVFTLAYSSDLDLKTMRNVLAEGDFSLK